MEISPGNKICRNGPIRYIILMYSSYLPCHIDSRIWREVDVIRSSQNLFLYIVRILHVLLCSELDFTCRVHKGIEHYVANIYLALEQHTFCGTVWLLQTLRNRNSRNHFAESENAWGFSCSLLAVWCRNDESLSTFSGEIFHVIT
jgi:hypothetical protein